MVEKSLTILIVEDESKMRDILSSFFSKKGYGIFSASSFREAIEILKTKPVHLVISDIRLSPQKEEGLELLRWIQGERKEIPVILITAYGKVRSAVEALKKGAYDYIEKPFDLDQLFVVTERALENVRLRLEIERLKAAIGAPALPIIGKSKFIEEIKKSIPRIAASFAHVLITGESGTGKELVARAIHQASAHAQEPFLAMNCAAFPETLLESELFGYMKGAFTDAHTDKPGLFKAARKGSIFLDEIAELSLSLQGKLLRVLEQREFYPLGATLPEKMEARVITATNKNLRKCIEEKTFREDLFFRLQVIHVHLPPLRERREDIPLLAQFFLDQCNEKYGKKTFFSPAALKFFMNYSFPGNIRELQNLIEGAVAMASEEEEIDPARFPVAEPAPEPHFASYLQLPFNEAKEKLMGAFMHEYFTRLLEKTGGNVSEAARQANIQRKQLQRYLKKI